MMATLSPAAIELSEFATLRGVSQVEALRMADEHGWCIMNVVAPEVITLERAVALVGLDLPILYLRLPTPFIRLAGIAGSFTVVTSGVSVADGVWRIDGWVVAADKGGEGVGASGPWMVSEAEWADALAELFNPAPDAQALTFAEAIGVLQVLFVDRAHVEVICVGYKRVHIVDTRAEGLFASVFCGPDGKWHVDPDVGFGNLRDIGVEPDPVREPEPLPETLTGAFTDQTEAAWCGTCNAVTNHGRRAYLTGLHTGWTCSTCGGR